MKGKYIMRAKNSYLKNFLISAFLFGISFSVVCALIYGDILKAFVLGISAGILFGILMTLFVMYISKKMNIFRAKLAEEHDIFFEGGANYWEGKNSLGGWLFLTESDLYFVAHKYNKTTKEIIIPYADIRMVSRSHKMKSIEILCIDGRLEAFVVNERKKWISKLNEKINDDGDLKNCNGDII